MFLSILLNKSVYILKKGVNINIFKYNSEIMKKHLGITNEFC